MHSNAVRLATWSWSALLALMGVFLAAGTAAEELATLAGVEITDLSGKKHTPGQSGTVLTVLVFLGTECPISNGYAPSLRRLHHAFATRSVVILGIHCDPEVTGDVAHAHAQEYELPFALVLDHEQRLARQCGVDTVPTAVVIGNDGRALYRGRIDNRYVATGVRRPEATKFDLQAAIEAVLAGGKPESATTEIVGCPLPPPRR